MRMLFRKRAKLGRLIALRVSEDERELLSNAASFYRVSMSEFIRNVAAGRARRVIRAQERTREESRPVA
jgi:uncharacterized protein (DUF1778 family)